MEWLREGLAQWVQKEAYRLTRVFANKKGEHSLDVRKKIHRKTISLIIDLYYVRGLFYSFTYLYNLLIKKVRNPFGER